MHSGEITDTYSQINLKLMLGIFFRLFVCLLYRLCLIRLNWAVGNRVAPQGQGIPKGLGIRKN